MCRGERKTSTSTRCWGTYALYSQAPATASRYSPLHSENKGQKKGGDPTKKTQEEKMREQPRPETKPQQEKGD